MPTAECLRSLDTFTLSPFNLRLNTGALVILLRNLQPLEDLCNGTRMVVTRINGRILECMILGGSFNGVVRLILRIDMTLTDDDLSYIIKRC